MTAASPAPPATAQASHNALLEAVRNVWDRLLGACLDLGQADLAAALVACDLRSDGAEGLILDPGKDPATRVLRRRPELRPLVASHLERLIDRPVVMRWADEVDGDDRRQRYQRAAAEPLVKRLQAVFDAEVLAYEPLADEAWQRLLASQDPNRP